MKPLKVEVIHIETITGHRTTSSSRTMNDTRAHYKITKTITGPDGKKHTETVEMVDNDAIKMMRDLRLRHDDTNRSPAHGSQSSTVSKRSTVAQDPNEFSREALQTHNELRRKHGVEPLRLNNELSKLAQQWANHLASAGSLIHSKTKYHNASVGENLRCQSWPITGKEMTEAWYNEHHKYDYHKHQSYPTGTGHFTQVVWKNSEEVGFGQAQGSSMNFAVAMYYPAGNYLGEFEKNVFPPK